MEFESGLKPSLSKMGMGIAFEYPGADFAPMGSKDFMIGDVVHKTRLEVDEEGTVAAAATISSVLLGCAQPRRQPKVVSLVVDRPFAVVLRDTAAGVTVFNGVVYEP
jgi:serpin B